MKGPIFLLMLFLHLAVSLKTDCPHPCITLDKCPDLARLIRTNVKVVQQATCSFQGVMPLVCCPKPSTPTPPTPSPKPPTPSPRPPTSNLLPKDCGVFRQGEKIHGGKRTRLGHYPWMAALGYRSSFSNEIVFKCGGSVINERYVLTAAHCVTSEQPEIIRLGDWDLTTVEDCEVTDTGFQFCSPEPAKDFLYEEIVTHPDYHTRAQVSDDIALIRLTEPVQLKPGGWIQPVCLPERSFNVRAAVSQRSAVATGWGSTENGTTSNVLLEVNLPLVDIDTCNITYRGRILDEQLCFGGKIGEDSCGGDSGGPLVVAKSNIPGYTQIGLVSYGPQDCGREGVPGVYTNVASYRDWIEQNLRE